LLDDLIVYLRAALPQMRSNTSTLGREVALAQAFLNVTPAGRGGTLACLNRIPPGLDDLPFPPMVLLPLVHAAADAGARRLGLDASVSPGSNTARVAVAVSVTVPGGYATAGWRGERFAAQRDIVAAYFGEDGKLDSTDDPEGMVATVRFTLSRSLVPSFAVPATEPANRFA
jgi:LytS/YehU family sensor histidine kinase